MYHMQFSLLLVKPVTCAPFRALNSALTYAAPGAPVTVQVVHGVTFSTLGLGSIS